MYDILLLHAQRYPAMKAEDGVKLCYQSEFGGGHLLPSREACHESIREERAASTKYLAESPLLEPIGGGLCRMHLNAKGAQDLSSGTIAGLFCDVSEKPRGTVAGFEEKLSLLRDMCAAGSMPFSAEELDSFVKGYKEAGYPLCRHSKAYRDAYHPAYRLVSAQTEKFLPLLMALDRRLMRRMPFLLAIDGPSGAGKSSLAAWLKRVYEDCEIFHMDDYFLPSQRKTADRLSRPGGNVDWERFLQEVFLPLKRGNPFRYRPFDCATGELKPPVEAAPGLLNIVEGVYSTHPAFSEEYDMKLFLTIGKEEQSRRILQRNGSQMHKRFVEEWIPLEDAYFLEMQIAKSCDLVLAST